MKIGIANQETWGFFDEIFVDLENHYQTALFKRRYVDWPIFNTRINKYLLRRDMENFLKEHNVVFFEWASELLSIATHLPKSCGIVTRLHRYEMYQWLHKINWDHVDKLILVSHAKQQEFVSEFPDQASKVIVIPEAISIDKFPLQTKEFNGDIGILCHLRPRKRVYELILAFSELIKLEPNLHLHIGGGEAPGFKEYSEALQVLVRKLQIKDKITFYGHVTTPISWFRKVDIFVSNSYSEGLQVSPMEAIASGCYCLSHHWDGADELLPNDDLYFSENEFIMKVLNYVNSSENDKNLRKSIQRNHVVENFDVKKTRLEIRQIIEEAAIK